jgi:hypothetical protein
MSGLASIALATSMSSSGKFWRATSGAAGASSSSQACLSTLADQTALEFRQRAEHVKNEPPLRGRRIEGFSQAAKPDPPDPQAFDGFDQLLHRPCQTVELPHDERVAAAREFERVKGWAVGHRTRHLLSENLPMSRTGKFRDVRASFGFSESTGGPRLLSPGGADRGACRAH